MQRLLIAILTGEYVDLVFPDLRRQRIFQDLHFLQHVLGRRPHDGPVVGDSVIDFDALADVVELVQASHLDDVAIPKSAKGWLPQCDIRICHFFPFLIFEIVLIHFSRTTLPEAVSPDHIQGLIAVNKA